MRHLVTALGGRPAAIRGIGRIAVSLLFVGVAPLSAETMPEFDPFESVGQAIDERDWMTSLPAPVIGVVVDEPTNSEPIEKSG